MSSFGDDHDVVPVVELKQFLEARAVDQLGRDLSAFSFRDRLLADKTSAPATARKAAYLEGLPIGISSVAALAAAFEVGARAKMKGKMIVTILPSFAERYLSTPLFDGLG